MQNHSVQKKGRLVQMDHGRSQRVACVFGRVVHSCGVLKHRTKIVTGFGVGPDLVTRLPEVVAERQYEQIQNRVLSTDRNIREDIGITKQTDTLEVEGASYGETLEIDGFTVKCLQVVCESHVKDEHAGGDCGAE